MERLEDRRLLATDVAGVIDQDDTWNGTIRVAGDVTVAAGVNLNIDPGTVIKFEQGAFLDVDGSINAIGSAAEPIIFTSTQDATVGEDLTDGVDGVTFAGM